MRLGGALWAWCALLCAGSSWAADQSSQQANQLIQSIKQRGGQCVPVSGGLGQKCTFQPGTFAGYPLRVTAYVPAGVSSISSFYVHFHGWLVGEGQTYESILRGFQFDKNLFEVAAIHNGVLIVPESKTYCVTFNEYFASVQNFNLFYAKMRSILRVGDAEKGEVFVSGHSGAQVAVGLLLRQALRPANAAAKITKVVLLDASYNYVDAIQAETDWVAQPGVGYERDLMVYYVPRWLSGISPGGGTEFGACLLAEKIFRKPAVFFDRTRLVRSDADFGVICKNKQIQKQPFDVERKHASGASVVVHGYVPKGPSNAHFQLAYDCMSRAWKGEVCR